MNDLRSQGGDIVVHLARFRSRARLVLVAEHAALATAAGVLAGWCSVVLGIQLSVMSALAGAGALVVAAYVAAVVRTPSLHRTALLVDARADLHDGAVTAWHCRHDEDECARLVREYAVSRVSAVAAAQVFPLTLPRRAVLAMAAAVCLPVFYQAVNFRSSPLFGAPSAAGVTSVVVPGEAGNGVAPAAARTPPEQERASPLARTSDATSAAGDEAADARSASAPSGRRPAEGDRGNGEPASDVTTGRSGGQSGGVLTAVDRSGSGPEADAGLRYRDAWTTAEEAIAQQRVPVRLRAAVRRYFTGLREDAQP
jgi:hypothetical protein